MKVRFYNIQWDTTDDDHPKGQDVDLPNEITLDVDEDTELTTEGADVLSDKYGWCVFGFDYEVFDGQSKGCHQDVDAFRKGGEERRF
jgi:hypothetical protein